MCGRIAIVPSRNGVQSRARATVFRAAERYRPTYNGGPGYHAPVVYAARADAGDCKRGDRVVHCMRWGLVRASVSALTA